MAEKRLTSEDVKGLCLIIEEAGAEKERARLRPLLQECLDLIESTGWRVQYQERAQVLLSDLRRELGLPDHQ